MEAVNFSSNVVAMEKMAVMCSIMEVVAVETLLAAGRSLACLLLASGAVLNDSNGSSKLIAIDQRFPFEELHQKKWSDVEAPKDGSDTEDDDEEDEEAEDPDDDDAGDEDFSGEEGEDDEEGDPEDDPEANGNDGGSDDDDDDDDEEGDGDEDGDDDEDEDEDEDEEEEVPQPPAKKRK